MTKLEKFIKEAYVRGVPLQSVLFERCSEFEHNDLCRITQELCAVLKDEFESELTEHLREYQPQLFTQKWYGINVKTKSDGMWVRYITSEDYTYVDKVFNNMCDIDNEIYSDVEMVEILDGDYKLIKTTENNED